jgi:hypothetical protein
MGHSKDSVLVNTAYYQGDIEAERRRASIFDLPREQVVNNTKPR